MPVTTSTSNGEVAEQAAEIEARVAGRTVPLDFLDTVARRGDAIALRRLEADSTWTTWSFNEVAERVAQAAAGLQQLGITRGDRVVLMMRNTPEFHWLDLAVLFLGGTPVSIYNSSSPDQIEYLAGHCEAKLAIVEAGPFHERFMKVAGHLDDLVEVLHPDDERLSGAGSAGGGADLDELVSIAQPTDTATIIYTSGTTGNPKGVVLSHANLCWTAESLLRSFGWSRDDAAGKRLVSYLPMAHIAERMTSHYGMALFGYDISCCPEPTLFPAYATQVHPNLVFGVPRVWEKLHAGVNAALGADPEKAQKFNEAVMAAAPIRERMTWGTASDADLETYGFLDAVAFSTVRGLIGLDEVELAVTGAAPIPAEIITWFRTIGVPLSEIYGMSESSGPISFSAAHPKPGTVGRSIPGQELRIAADGEVCFRGGNVFGGYLGNPEATADTIDDEGWVHTGDIGEIDDEGYLRIVDRKKELIITAGGKNVSPANLEAALKTIPLVGQAAVIGDNRPFISALLVLDPEVAPVWAAQRGIEPRDLESLAQNDAVVAEVERGVAEVMQGFNHAEQVKKWVLLGEEWLPDSDVLTPTSKLKRRGVNVRYNDSIEAMYA